MHYTVTYSYQGNLNEKKYQNCEIFIKFKLVI
jgi:hypothetical protein